MTEFRFYNEVIYELAEQMQLSDEIAIYNDLQGASVPVLYFYNNNNNLLLIRRKYLY